MHPDGMEIRVLATPGDATEHALAELRRLAVSGRSLVSLATGATYAPLFGRIAEKVGQGALDLGSMVITHPDEFLGYGPDREGGMVHELTTACPTLGSMLRRGTFLPVPPVDDERALAAHGARLARAGGVALQFLGLGRNGHVAFNEPGSPVERGFRRVRLAETTRSDARARFAPAEPPTHAITAGLGELLASRRVVLMATGRGKAEVVRTMLEGEIEPACPASSLRRHGDLLVLLDRAAAALLKDQRTCGGEAGSET